MAADNVTPIRSAPADGQPPGPPTLADELFTASIFITQATGIIETIIALKPVASQLNDGEITQALYAAVDQLRRALAIVDPGEREAVAS